MPRIRKPKYLDFKNRLPDRIPNKGELVSILCDDGSIYLEGKVSAFDTKGFKITSYAGRDWWWDEGTFGYGGSNGNKFLRMKA